MPVAHINPYLIDAPDVVLPRRSKPICAVPEIRFGNQPIDGGHLILNKLESDYLRKTYPELKPYIRLFLGSDEFINGGKRWCLWLKDCPSALIRAIPEVMKRLAEVKKFRLESVRVATRDLAATPSEFAFVSHTGEPYIIVPSVSSERRSFVPMGFATPSLVISNLCLAIYGANLQHFGVLNSTMHNAWVRATCGRMKSDLRYSNSIVYNNFPWPGYDPKSTLAQSKRAKTAIESAAKAVLDARAEKKSQSLADLYDPLVMPAGLRRAHQKLDKAVDAAYGYKSTPDDASRVAFLFELYQQLTGATALVSDAKAAKPPKPRLLTPRASTAAATF